MLSFLHLRDFALIDELSLEFFPGMNVLTGETGAGKSILIGAINLILGERATSEQVRTGCSRAIIEAVFTTSEENVPLKKTLELYGLDLKEELIVTREISRSGRNICRINGRIVPLAVLKELGMILVDLHGQHSHQSLLKPERHLYLLDEFGGDPLLKIKRHMVELINRRQKIREKLNEHGISPQQRARQLEMLRFQRDEISAASLSIDEEKSLRERLLLLDNMEKLLSAVNRAYTQIYGNNNHVPAVLDIINSIKEELTSLEKIDPDLSPFIQILQEVSTALTELGHDLYSYSDRLIFFPEEREEIENRLELYRRLKSKYGNTVEEILSFEEQCRNEINILESNEEKLLQLEKDSQKLQVEIDALAEELTEKRKEIAEKLELQITEALQELGMANARFKIDFIPKDVPDRRGKEELEFLFSANPGEPLKPLARIISAGEMARVMLALKSILAEQDNIPVLIFDEIDSGIGGKTIQKVSEKMMNLGKKHQVISVTHNAHIASAADHQYYLYKEVLDGRTTTRASYLEGEKRLLEIARMLNGDTTGEITRRHAEELLKNFRKDSRAGQYNPEE
ncbi:MAG TPA: DNA repair protein RecN [Firmicutes bacterium]|nr:DNA repair protein RecN [Bacillota bacterium]